MTEPAADQAGPRRLVLVRHGRTAWNLQGRAQGHTDVCLDEVGHAQAAAMASYVAAMCPARLWSSDLRRARQTAAYVAEATGLEVRTDPRLREFDVGERAGLTVAEFAERFPREHAAWMSGHVTGGVPGAETIESIAARAVPALRDALAVTEPGETSVIVGHGACLRVAVVALLGWPQTLLGELRGLDNCGWVVVEEHPSGRGLRMASYNETAHPAEHGPDFVSDAPVR